MLLCRGINVVGDGCYLSWRFVVDVIVGDVDNDVDRRYAGYVVDCVVGVDSSAVDDCMGVVVGVDGMVLTINAVSCCCYSCWFGWLYNGCAIVGGMDDVVTCTGRAECRYNVDVGGPWCWLLW